MTTLIVAVIVASLTFVLGYLLGKAAGVKQSQRIVAYALQTGLMHMAHPPSGAYDDLTPRFVEPIITGDATLETDYREPPSASPYL